MIRFESYLTIAVPLVALLIIAVDFHLGATAEYLNAYEIVRRTFQLPLPFTSDRYLMLQDHLGLWTLPVGWLMFLVEAVLIAGLLFGAGKLVLMLSGSCRAPSAQ